MLYGQTVLLHAYASLEKSLGAHGLKSAAVSAMVQQLHGADLPLEHAEHEEGEEEMHHVDETAHHHHEGVCVLMFVSTWAYFEWIGFWRGGGGVEVVIGMRVWIS